MLLSVFPREGDVQKCVCVVVQRCVYLSAGVQGVLAEVLRVLLVSFLGALLSYAIVCQ